MHENEGVVSEGVLHTPGGNSDDSDNDDDNEATTEQQVQEALLNVLFLRDVEVEPSACDTNEDELVTNFVATGCSCTKRCSSQFSKDHIQSMRANCLQLSHNELDMVLLGQLVASTNTSDKVVTESRHTNKERKRGYTTYYHAGKVMCTKTFIFLHTVGKKRLKTSPQA